MKKRKNTILKTISLATVLSASALFVSGCDDEASTPAVAPPNNPVITFRYEVWGTDQSNTEAGAAAIGTQGSAMYTVADSQA